MAHSSYHSGSWSGGRRKSEQGQALVYGLFVLIGGLASLFFLFNTGQLTREKTKLVNTSDAAAYSAGVMNARALNFQAYTNRAMLANTVAIAQLVSLSSWVQYTGNVATYGYALENPKFALFYPSYFAAQTSGTYLQESLNESGTLEKLPVDEINSISGLLEPGDLIDLMVTVDQKGKKITVPLMQGVQVMATGQRAVDDPKSGERKIYSTVTLDTDPRQAQNVIVAREAGRITALLRNPQDKTTTRAGQGDLTALLGATPMEAGRGGLEVPVLYGGRAGKIPPEGLRLGLYVQAAASAPAPAAPASVAVAP